MAYSLFKCEHHHIFPRPPLEVHILCATRATWSASGDAGSACACGGAGSELLVQHLAAVWQVAQDPASHRRQSPLTTPRSFCM